MPLQRSPIAIVVGNLQLPVLRTIESRVCVTISIPQAVVNLYSSVGQNGSSSHPFLQTRLSECKLDFQESSLCKLDILRKMKNEKVQTRHFKKTQKGENAN